MKNCEVAKKWVLNFRRLNRVALLSRGQLVFSDCIHLKKINNKIQFFVMKINNSKCNVTTMCSIDDLT